MLLLTAIEEDILLLLKENPYLQKENENEIKIEVSYLRTSGHSVDTLSILDLGFLEKIPIYKPT